MSAKALNIQNKKAKFEYHLLEQFTAGIQLKGTEIKSIRNGKASIMEAYGVFLPVAHEIKIFNHPLSEIKSLTGTSAFPLVFKNFSIFEISFAFNNSLRSVLG